MSDGARALDFAGSREYKQTVMAPLPSELLRRIPGSGADGGSDVSVLVASDWAPIRAFERIIRRDPEAVYGDLLPLLRSADLRAVNCEGPLTRARRPIWKSGSVLKGSPSLIDGLACVPFEVAGLANNHVFDYGLEGFKETLAVLRRAGIRTFGAGLSLREALAPRTVMAKGTRVSFVGFSEGEDLTASTGGPGVCGWEIDRLAAIVRGLKARGDVVIAVGHAGVEYIPFPPPYVVAAYRTLSQAGADAVIGHHPHVPQGLEVRRGRLIAYSLGNFVFFQPTDLRARRTGFSLRLDFKAGRLASYALVPHAITEGGLRRLGPREESDFVRRLCLLGKALRSPQGVEDGWNAYLAHYGLRGLKKELHGILGIMRSDPRKGAAMLRNRVATLQHAVLWRDVLTRQLLEKRPTPPPWMSRTLREWLTRRTPPGWSQRP